MELMPDMIANRLQTTDYSKKRTVVGSRSTISKPAFTLIELLVACHPKLQRRKAIPGFTLIELLVVISIIAILMAVATISYTNAQQKGRDNKRKADLKAVQQALEIYFNQNGKYPIDGGAGGEITCNVTGDSNPQPWGTEFDCDENGSSTDPTKITYMNPLPKDPVFVSGSSQNYYYDQTGTSTYILSARLENTKDQDYRGHPTTNTSCTPQGWTAANLERNYCVINP